jgi:hypothetical protein
MGTSHVVLLLYFEEALAGHIAFLAARGVIWSPACVVGGEEVIWSPAYNLFGLRGIA